MIEMGDAPCEMDWLMKPLASRELTASPSQGLLRSLHSTTRQQHLTREGLHLGQLHVGDGGGCPLHPAVDLDCLPREVRLHLPAENLPHAALFVCGVEAVLGGEGGGGERFRRAVVEGVVLATASTCERVVVVGKVSGGVVVRGGWGGKEGASGRSRGCGS